MRELQIELRRTLTTDAMLTVLETKFNNTSTVTITADTVIFLLGKVLAKVVASRMPKEWTRFQKVTLIVT